MPIVIVLVLFVVGSFLFHFLSPWWFTPLASNWGSMDATLVMTFWISGFVFAAVGLFTAYSVYKFRYRPDRRADFEPENKKLEGWLTGFTAIGVIAMLAPGLIVWEDFVNVPEDAAEFEALATQWQWKFRFPGEDGVFGEVDTRRVDFDNVFGINPDDPNGQDDILIAGSELHLPVDKPVKALLRSLDVLHNFYVPNFRAKMDIVPGLVSYFWFIPTVSDTFDLICAEYCGTGHYVMSGTVVIEGDDAFQTWLADQPTFAETMAGDDEEVADMGDPVAAGRVIAENQGCIACHSLNGSAGVGPTWKGLFGKTETMDDGTTVVVDDAYLRESIVDPNARVVEGYEPFMQAYEMSDAELDALIAFIKADEG